VAARILYVDDSPLARAAAARLLGARGFDVVVAGSAAEARAIDPLALRGALLDLEVGEESGTTIAEALRAARPELPVAFLTAAAEVAHLERARGIGPVFSKATETDRAVAWLSGLPA
jgi:two-component system cell cycle sensor histidine kinase/response regulator CckA